MGTFSSPRDDAETGILIGESAPDRQRLWLELPVSGVSPLLAVIAFDGAQAELSAAAAPHRLFAALAARFPRPEPRRAGPGGTLGPLIEVLPLGSKPELRLLPSLASDPEAAELINRGGELPGPYLTVRLGGFGATIASLLAKGAPLRIAPLAIDLATAADRWRIPRVFRSGSAHPLAQLDAMVFVGSALPPSWADLPVGSLDGFSRAADPPLDLLRRAGLTGARDLYAAPLARFDRASRWIAR